MKKFLWCDERLKFFESLKYKHTKILFNVSLIFFFLKVNLLLLMLCLKHYCGYFSKLRCTILHSELKSLKKWFLVLPQYFLKNNLNFKVYFFLITMIYFNILGPQVLQWFREIYVYIFFFKCKVSIIRSLKYLLHYYPTFSSCSVHHLVLWKQLP